MIFFCHATNDSNSHGMFKMDLCEIEIENTSKDLIVLEYQVRFDQYKLSSLLSKGMAHTVWTIGYGQ